MEKTAKVAVFAQERMRRGAFQPAESEMARLVSSTEYLHIVNDEGRHYTVCLQKKNYSCGRFQVDELPCLYAWAILKSKFLMPDNYCSDYYKPKSVVMTYEVPVYPLPDRN
nr:uncharacterized protein LOC104108323 [Nicotiana tomentosiformis]